MLPPCIMKWLLRRNRSWLVASATVILVGCGLLIFETAAETTFAAHREYEALRGRAHNTRLTVVHHWFDQGSQLEFLILRESFYVVVAPNIQGSRIVVEVLDGEDLRARFEDQGERGDLVTDNIYKITRNGDPTTYTFYSLRSGEKLKTVHVDLNRHEIMALDASVRD